jgi:hypothetical protein
MCGDMSIVQGKGFIHQTRNDVVAIPGFHHITITQSPTCQTKVSLSTSKLTVAGRQSPPPEEQDPKQGEEATAKGTIDKDNSEFDKATGEEKKGSENALDGLESNPDKKARV